MYRVYCVNTTKGKLVGKIYDGTCSECHVETKVMNDPAGWQTPFCQSCYYVTFESPVKIVRG